LQCSLLSPDQRPLPCAPLDPSDDAGIEKAVRAFMDLSAPIETACEDQKSDFFHFLFSLKHTCTSIFVKSTGLPVAAVGSEYIMHIYSGSEYITNRDRDATE
jgi:hypothetical protein